MTRLRFSTSVDGICCSECAVAVEPILGHSMIDGVRWLWWRCTQCDSISQAIPVPDELFPHVRLEGVSLRSDPGIASDPAGTVEGVMRHGTDGLQPPGVADSPPGALRR